MTMQLIPLVPAERKVREMRRQNSSCPELWDCLEEVKDPEIPALSLWDMGILQDATVESDGGEQTAVVTITPTYSGCPAMDVIREDIETAVLNRGYVRVSVVNRLSPAWTTDWMTPDAQKRLREFGIAAPDDMTGGDGRMHEMESPDDLQVRCPQCASENTRLISEFGSTACKALMQCNDCAETFDYFKRI